MKALTNGRGVEVILNSLAGEFQEATLSLLAPFGRFVEIGKRDLYDDRKTGLYKFRENASFHIVDLSALHLLGETYTKQMASEIFNNFGPTNGFYPICHTIFAANEIHSAFKFMSKGTHVGKIVISFDQPPTKILPRVPEPKKIDPNATYIVTGGTRGLGAEFAAFLIINGAKNVVVLSKSGIPKELPQLNPDMLSSIQRSIVAYKVDVSDKKALSRVIERIKAKHPPIKGIIHAASIYWDQLIPDINQDSFSQVCMVKGGGAWYLHQLTLDLPLDFFILTSSIASSLGNGGQMSYAVANSFLDQLASYRKQLGLVATSVNYGPILDAGFVKRDEKIAQRMNRLGVELLPARLALQFTEFARNVGISNVAAMRVNFQNWVKMSGGSEPPPLLEEVYTEVETGLDLNKMNHLLSQIKILEHDQASRLVIDYVKQSTAQILGIEPSQIADDDAFQQIGLDSLMAVEMQYKLERSFDIKISPVEVAREPTISGLAKIIIKQVKAE